MGESVLLRAVFVVQCGRGRPMFGLVVYLGEIWRGCGKDREPGGPQLSPRGFFCLPEVDYCVAHALLAFG
jgi:hypothetical protein